MRVSKLVLLLVFPQLTALIALAAAANGFAQSNETTTAEDLFVALARTVGQGGVDLLHSRYEPCFTENNECTESLKAELQTMESVFDRVCAQKDCRASRLFWHTDIEAAKRRSAEEKKPILALYMLGRLDEDHSCANSRFFRSVLYSNKKISDYLRETFVLFWHNQRDLPRSTIEFPDGRRIEQTRTGNSVHYVLDSNMRVIEVMPGLVSPLSFRAFLRNGENRFKQGHSLYEAEELGKHERNPIPTEVVLMGPYAGHILKKVQWTNPRSSRCPRPRRQWRDCSQRNDCL